MREGVVEVNPARVKAGPPREASPPRETAGLPQCSWGEQDADEVEGPPGFVRPRFQCSHLGCEPVQWPHDLDCPPYSQSQRKIRALGEKAAENPNENERNRLLRRILELKIWQEETGKC